MNCSNLSLVISAERVLRTQLPSDSAGKPRRLFDEINVNRGSCEYSAISEIIFVYSYVQGHLWVPESDSRPPRFIVDSPEVNCGKLKALGLLWPLRTVDG
jgi:hypothetical protein